MEFHVLELPKLPKELKDSSDNVLLWAKFINAERKEEFEMIATKDPYIASAYQKLQVISQDKQKRLEYEAREKAIRDYNQFMYEADQRGEKRGIERGIKIGGRKNVLNKHDMTKDINVSGVKVETAIAFVLVREAEKSTWDRAW